MGSSDNPIWDKSRVIPRFGTVRDHFRLDIPYQIGGAPRHIEGTPETKVVDAVEADEARVGGLVDIRADGGELGRLGVRGAVGEGSCHLGPCERGEGEQAGEEGKGKHGRLRWEDGVAVGGLGCGGKEGLREGKGGGE